MWTDRLALALPLTLIAEANAIGAIIDPDSGGSLTFSSDQTVGDYVVAYVPFTEQMRGVVTRRVSAEWQAAIAQRATDKGMEPLPVETIEALRAALLCGDELAVLSEETE
jgi:hypothetical protein